MNNSSDTIGNRTRDFPTCGATSSVPLVELSKIHKERRSRNGISYTGYTQENGAVSKVNKKCISHLTWAQRTPSAATTVPVSHALITVLQCVHPGSHDTHPHGNQIHLRLGVACPL